MHRTQNAEYQCFTTEHCLVIEKNSFITDILNVIKNTHLNDYELKNML